MYERFTDDARRTMQLANEIAIRIWQHEYIGTEHFLLAIASQPNTHADRLLRRFDIDPLVAKRKTEGLLKEGTYSGSNIKIPQTARAKKAVEYSMEECRLLDFHYVDNDHLVLGLIREKEGVAAQVLRELGAQLDGFREWVDGAHYSKIDPGLRPVEEVKLEPPKAGDLGVDSTINAPSIELLLDRGSASSEEVAELFTEISTLHRMLGGAGINFTVTDCRLPTGGATPHD